MENLKLTLCYDGSGYHGWQRQENAMTVQQRVEEVLSRITKTSVTVTGCSRTDAGVHAKEYVCNVHTMTSVPDEKIQSYVARWETLKNFKNSPTDFNNYDAGELVKSLFQAL